MLKNIEEVLDEVRLLLSGCPLTLESLTTEPSPKVTLSLSGGDGPGDAAKMEIQSRI